MIARRTSLAGQLGPFLLAFGLALPLAALSGHVAPLRGVSGVEIGNDFIALTGLVFAAIQTFVNRRSEAHRTAWGRAMLGTLIIALEDHLEPFLAPLGHGLVEAVVSGVFWIAAASLIVNCGRAYAMRRAVMTVLRSGFAVTAAAIVLNLATHAFGSASSHHGLGRVEDFIELAATALFVGGLLLTQLAPMKTYQFPADAIGARARALFYDFGLETRRRYPAPHPILALPGFSHVLLLAIIARFMPGAAGAVSREAGRSVPAQLFDLLRLGFVHGVDAKSYYVHELYRQEPGLIEATMTRVETKNGLNRWVQKLRADCVGPRDMNDKLEFWRSCEAFGVPSARIMATVEDGAIVWMGGREAFDRDLFVKDRKGRGGRFTLNFERVGPLLYRDDDGATVNFDEVVLELQALSAGRRLIVQPKLRNHAEIRSLADKSLVVFRVMTCLDARGEPQLTHGVMRLLRRFEPAWPKTEDADWGCAIDIETGELGLMTGDAPETCTRWFADHPATGERVTGRVLADWGDIARVALAAHRVFSTRVFVGWDIGLTPEGPVILEGNSNPDFSYFQRVYRTPVGRSPLGPLLNAHLVAVAAQAVARTSPPQPRTADARPGATALTTRVADRAAGLLSDARFSLWRRSSPGRTYAEFYAHRVNRLLDRGAAHKTLGLRRYRADPSAAPVQDPATFAGRGLRYFRWFETRSLRSDMVCVEYGCGSLRVGQHFIRHLDPGCYIGLDVVDRFYRDGLTLLGSGLVAAKRPYLATIDTVSLDRAARRNPDLIYSTAVLHHVPPSELDNYFRAIVSMMGPHSAAVASFRSADRTIRTGASSWSHSFASLAASLGRIDPSLIVWRQSQPDLGERENGHAMLIFARSPEQMARWSSGG